MILLTRPTPHLPASVKKLAAAGHTDVIAFPISTPRYLPLALPAGCTALLFTSPLGVHPALPKLPSCCVGIATAHAAEKAGFPVTLIGNADAQALAERITESTLAPQHFLHPHGNQADLSWHKTLTAKGHRITPILTYQTIPATTIPPQALAQLQTTPPQTTLLMSVEGTRTLITLLQQHNLPFSPQAIAITEKVAHFASKYWKVVKTAENPSLSAIIEQLKEK